MCLPVQCWFFTITINWWNVLVLFLRIFLLWSKNRKYNMIQLNLFKKYRYLWHFCSCSYFQDVSFKEMQPSQITHCGNWMHAFCAHGRCHGIWLSERMLSILLKCFQSRWFYLEMSIKSKCQQYAQGCETKFEQIKNIVRFSVKQKYWANLKYHLKWTESPMT